MPGEWREGIAERRAEREEAARERLWGRGNSSSSYTPSTSSDTYVSPAERERQEAEQRKRDQALARAYALACEQKRLHGIALYYTNAMTLTVLESKESKFPEPERMPDSPEALAFCSTPRVHALNDEYNRQYALRRQKWVDRRHMTDLFHQIMSLTAWYARKRLLDALWKNFESKLTGMRQTFEELTKTSGGTEGKDEAKGATTNHKKLEELSQMIDAFEKARPCYETLEAHYQKEGLHAYAKMLCSPPTQELLQPLLSEWIKPHLRDDVLDHPAKNLSTEELATFKKCLQCEFKRPNLTVGGISISDLPAISVALDEIDPIGTSGNLPEILYRLHEHIILQQNDCESGVAAQQRASLEYKRARDRLITTERERKLEQEKERARLLNIVPLTKILEFKIEEKEELKFPTVEGVPITIESKDLGKDDEKKEIPFDETKQEARQHYAILAAKAIEDGNLGALKICLGPSLHGLRREYEQQHYHLHEAWLKHAPAVEVAQKALFLATLYSRKLLYDMAWKDIIKEFGELDTLRLTLTSGTQTIASCESKEVKKGISQDKTLEELLEILPLYEKAYASYHVLETIYQRKGLIDYADNFCVSAHQELQHFLRKRLSSAVFHDQIVLRSRTFSLEEKREFEKKLHQELSNSRLKLVEMKVLVPQATHLAAPSVSSLPKSKMDSSSSGSSATKTTSMAEAISAASPPLTTASPARGETKVLGKCFPLVGSPEWHERYQLVLKGRHRPPVSRITTWEGILGSLIDGALDLPGLLLRLQNCVEEIQKTCDPHVTTQRQITERFLADVAARKKQFRADAIAWLRQNPETITIKLPPGEKVEKEKDIIEAFVDSILACEIGETSLDDPELKVRPKTEKEEGKQEQAKQPLLHSLMADYLNKKDSAAKEKYFPLVVYLIKERGASPYTQDKKGKIVFGSKGNKKEGEENKLSEPDWDLVQLTFEAMKPLSPYAERVCRYVSQTYCPNSKTEEAGFFYGFWHSRPIKKDRRQELIALGALLYKSKSSFQERASLTWLKQKAGLPLLREEKRTISADDTVDVAKRGGRKRSALYQNIAVIIGEAETGKLEYFDFDDAEQEMDELQEPFDKILKPA